jgi:hypothetical protein
MPVGRGGETSPCFLGRFDWASRESGRPVGHSAEACKRGKLVRVGCSIPLCGSKSMGTGTGAMSAGIDYRVLYSMC